MMHTRTVPPRTLLRGALLALAMTACCAASANADGYRVPVRKWLETYITYVQEQHLEPEGTFNAPMIWLFSPKGEMTRIVTVNDDPDLSKLRAALPLADAKPIAGQLSWSQTRELLAKASDSTASAQSGGDTWHAVLFLSDSPDCKHCAAFDRDLRAIEAQVGSKLEATRLTVQF